jgi:hypothetical protein
MQAKLIGKLPRWESVALGDDLESSQEPRLVLFRRLSVFVVVGVARAGIVI